MPCEIKTHDICDGTGHICDFCGENEAVCQCDDDEKIVSDCPVCDGTGQFCVTHQSTCGSVLTPHLCDKAIAKRKK
jgi:hypothetical protein